MVKLIALDLDGTLLDAAGGITQASRDAIARARRAGVRVVLNTGRAGPEAAWFARTAGCDGLLSCVGGAALVNGETGKTLRRWDVPEPTGDRVLELCLGRGIELMIFLGEAILLDPFSRDSLRRGYPYPIFHRTAVTVQDPLAYKREHRLPLTKLHGDGRPGAYPLAELAALPGVELTCSNDHDFELLPAGVDKGRALARIARMYGIPLAECAAVGDSDNDLPMLRAVGTPIAMGNASPRVKEQAGWITASNAEEGVARAILHCLE